MKQHIKSYLERQKMEFRGGKLLLACSGGADSVALVRCYHDLAEEMGWTLGIVHADHQLREQASHQDRVFVEELGKQLDLPVYSAALPVPERLQHGGNTQQVCREERYTYFASILHTYDYDALVQGHHGDDQIETVLMQLTKGSDGALLGIPAKRQFQDKWLIRPLLSVNREQIEAYLTELHQSYREDASNQTDAYTRNRFRHHVLPFLYQENPAVQEQFSRAVEQHRQDEDVLHELSQSKFHDLLKRSQNGHATLDGKGFQALPIALQRRVILLLWNYVQPNAQALSSKLLQAILTISQSTHGTQYLSLPNEYQLIRSYQDISMTRTTPQQEFPELQIVPEEWIQLPGGMKLLLTQSDEKFPAEHWYVDLDEDDFPLFIRGRKDGDFVEFEQFHKKVSRILIDCKVPKEKRDGWPLLVSQKNGILGLIGLRYGKWLTKHTKTPWVIWIKQEDSTC